MSEEETVTYIGPADASRAIDAVVQSLRTGSLTASRRAAAALSPGVEFEVTGVPAAAVLERVSGEWPLAEIFRKAAWGSTKSLS